MTQRVAVFEKVTEKQYLEGFEKCRAGLMRCLTGKEPDPKALWESIRLPRRATSGSAGYDFFTPAEFTLSAGESLLLPTGIRAKITDGWFLACFPRSGLGFKYRLQLDNTVGIIDSDYYFTPNEGHIFVRMTNDSREGKQLTVAAQNAFMQGIFLPYGLTMDDSTETVREGGLGSTDR